MEAEEVIESLIRALMFIAGVVGNNWLAHILASEAGRFPERGGGPVRMDSLRLVALLLTGSWIVAVAFSIPHFFFVKVEGSTRVSQTV
ncbi:hypothetical protein WMY93_020982 [Mugilogobius chulae]|uniref:Uncharacterized protein n=1 Tax=Mugilogobius chulae TaxID=88201 RepID=A0AAW0N9C6_9GOBI